MAHDFCVNPSICCASQNPNEPPEGFIRQGNLHCANYSNTVC